MKIIGRTKDNYLVEVDENELARVMGFDWMGGDGTREHLRSIGALDTYGKIYVGVKIPVGEMWNRLSDIRRREQELKKLSGTMRSLADLIGDTFPAITLPATEPTKEG